MRKDPMFRYLEKFVGTYRVLPQLTDEGDVPREPDGSINKTFEDLYIPCQRGEIRHTYRPGILVWVCLDRIGQGRGVYRAIVEKYPKLELEYEEVGDDVLIYFNENDIKKIATIVKPRTAGAKIQPFAKRNLSKNALAEYKIPDEDNLKLTKALVPLEQAQKMVLSKKWIKDFDTVIVKKKGKNYDVIKERDESGLKPKMFIHSIGLWDDYIKFINKEIKKLNNND